MDNVFDKMFYPEGELIAGIDEAGVSDMAGPLIAGCVILPKIDLHKDDLRIFEVNDSKKIPERFRKQYAEIIWQFALGIGIGEVSPSEVDYLGKINAIHLAMNRAVAACKTTGTRKPISPDFIIRDQISGANRPLECGVKEKIIELADEKSLCVAAASVIAKVYRDEIMIHLHDQYPYYNWISNKGFPCEDQFKGIDEQGLQIGIHRMTFWPIKKWQSHPEDAAMWKARRAAWKRITEQKLGGKQWKNNIERPSAAL